MRRPARAALAALAFAALSVTGCVSMPSGGPVLSYPVTQGTAAQSQPNVQIQPQPPHPGWSPTDIVRGFLTASANFGNYPQVAKAYLTPDEQDWDPAWSAVVYKSGPNVAAATYSPSVKNATTAFVKVTGSIQATLQGNGSYSVPSASASGGSPHMPSAFKLTKVGGQWRIASAPLELLLSSNSFANDYQLSNLYFFDPLTKFLVPDPVYVPVISTHALLAGLVNELISPPTDWLSFGATKTAFPPKTKVSDVTLDGVTAVVSLTGAAIGKAGTDVMEQVSAQLLSTLSDAATSGSAGQGVQSVEVVVNGRPWYPPATPGNPVQRTPKWNPADGSSDRFYSVDSKGNLTSRTAPGSKPVTVARIGTSYSQIAVSADERYLAALHGSTLYTGTLGGPLTKRGTGFVAMSWDASDNLWASQNNQIVEFRGTANPRQPLAQTVQVNVSGGPGGPYTELAVAPDGVRVAIVSGGNQLVFGAIAQQPGQNPVITLSPVQQAPLTQVQSAPAQANFTALSWYGPDNVIALATPGPSVTEYPVSGAAPTSIQADPSMTTITASQGQPLIAGLHDGRMLFDVNVTGSWMRVNNSDDTPADGSSPIYPG